MEQFNRAAYLDIVTGYGPPGPDGNRQLALVIALEIDDDEERLKKRGLGTLDESSSCPSSYSCGTVPLGALQMM